MSRPAEELPHRHRLVDLEPKVFTVYRGPQGAEYAEVEAREALRGMELPGIEGVCVDLSKVLRNGGVRGAFIGPKNNGGTG
jgi:hypothetical protein